MYITRAPTTENILARAVYCFSVRKFRNILYTNVHLVYG